jgi:hypothetical protein
MRESRGKTVTVTVLMAVAAACTNGGSQPPPNPPPTPVRVLAPSTRPDLNINAFLFSNNTILSCDEFANFKLAGVNQTVNTTSHFEPPIGAWDGSFKLDMEPERLLGTTASTLKLCGKTHSGDHQATWELVWKIWRSNGTVLTQGRDPLDINSLKNVEVAFVNNSTHKVLFEYTSLTGGRAWAVTASGATFKGNQVSGFELDVPNPQTLRISELIKNKQDGTSLDRVELTRPKVRGSCAAFRICHDGEGCELPKIPAPCNPRPKPNPSGKSPSRL